MTFAMHATKLVVRDVPAAERFYTGLGLKFVSRNVGGEDVVHQEQCWLSTTGDMNSHVLILTRFVELPPPPRPVYPGEIWLCFMVEDVDQTVAGVEAAGGSTLRVGEDRPEHAVRAAVVADPEGHVIELVGPMKAGG
ncbi:MAG: VOC family protein [Novosphingobium sp.]|nr:VOC family protein [Novosphingobium sp.]MCP5404385.1 VOC family protein [Novosphingobium sp.]